MLRWSLLRPHIRATQLFRRRFCQSTIAAHIEQPHNKWRPFNEVSVDQPPPFEYDALYIAMQKKQKIEIERALKKRKLVNPAVHQREGSNEEILQLEVEELLNKLHEADSGQGSSEDGKEAAKLQSPLVNFPREPVIPLKSEVELDIVELSSTGDGLAWTPSKDHVIAVPFAVPGDRVLARVYKYLGPYSHADFIKVIEPSTKREGVKPECKYFTDCGGCAFQMISYDEQLKHKKKIVEKAFKYFSGLDPSHIPEIKDTIGSPMAYKYRTKLTPHFDGPGRRKGDNATFTSVPRIGYNRKNRREVIDIETCPIGTDIVQAGLSKERAKVAVNYKTYRTGKTILLRETTTREPEADRKTGKSPVAEFDTTTEPQSVTHETLPDGRPERVMDFGTHRDRKTYTTAETSMSTEYIGPHKFINRAGSFFQNNNSILGPFTKYIYESCVSPSTDSSISPPSSTATTTTTTTTAAAATTGKREIKYLLDAYCGSGLFTITLSSLFTSALGIDIDGRGIESARINAAVNDIPNAGFIEADASDLFADVPFPPDQSLVVIDPPRKGASEDFLRQLCQFGARRVIYVSCNVHTQARDVGMIVRGFGGGPGDGENKGWTYEIQSLRGFDFFPQTSHVEGVCVLNRVEKKMSSTET